MTRFLTDCEGVEGNEEMARQHAIDNLMKARKWRPVTVDRPEVQSQPAEDVASSGGRVSEAAHGGSVEQPLNVKRVTLTPASDVRRAILTPAARAKRVTLIPAAELARLNEGHRSEIVSAAPRRQGAELEQPKTKKRKQVERHARLVVVGPSAPA